MTNQFYKPHRSHRGKQRRAAKLYRQGIYVDLGQLEYDLAYEKAVAEMFKPVDFG